MKHDENFHLHCAIYLDCGRKITLDELVQSRTYWGMMLGSPNNKSNDRNIDRAIKLAANHLVGEMGTPHLIHPNRRNYRAEPGDMDDIQAKTSRVIEWLPHVRCIGVFTSFPPARDESKFQSCLTVVWYQDEYAMPFDEEVLKAIKSMNWNKLAADLDFD